jgi:hypothetical protein
VGDDAELTIEFEVGVISGGTHAAYMVAMDPVGDV